MGEIFVFLFLFGYLCRRKKRGMWNVECGMRNEECGMWNEECGMWNVE